MPGKKITDQQVLKYIAMERQATQQIAAARMGISALSARRIEKSEEIPIAAGTAKLARPRRPAGRRMASITDAAA